MKRRLHVITAALIATAATSLAGCGTASAAQGADGASTSRPHQWVMVLDRSASLKPAAIQDEQVVLKQITASLSFGDQLVVQEMHWNGVHDGAHTWVTTMPSAKVPGYVTPSDSATLNRKRNSAASLILKVFFDSAHKAPPYTDITSTLHTVASYANPASATAVVLLSDMMQSTPAWDMEQAGGAPTGSTVAHLAAQHLIPNLKGVCVLAIGPDPTTPRGIHVRDFWIEYFKVAGASLTPARYRPSPPLTSQIECQ